MKHRSFSRAFTIVELLVVVSIIALLIGILLPAIGKARDNAKLTQSQANLKQILTAFTAYSAEFNDRQVTFLDDNWGKYGTSYASAQSAYLAAHPAPPGTPHGGLGGGGQPQHWFGQNDANVLYYWNPISENRYAPMVFSGSNAGIGTFRLWHDRPMNAYMNGRSYDPTFYAPKDLVTLATVEPLFDNPGEWAKIDDTLPLKWVYSSYCMSPAAMYAPTVFSRDNASKGYWTDPYSIDAGFRSPAVGQAQYASQKTWIIEHQWLQNRRIGPCNIYMTSNTLDCEPWYYNAGTNSAPVAAFFDGHIAPAGLQDAFTADSRVFAQTTAANPDQAHGLWSRDTPLANTQIVHYFAGIGVMWEWWNQNCFHTLTVDGIKGRDFVR